MVRERLRRRADADERDRVVGATRHAHALGALDPVREVEQVGVGGRDDGEQGHARRQDGAHLPR